MPHFLVKKDEIKNNFIDLKDKETFLHLVKSLRIKVGENVKFIDENKVVYNSKVVEINKNSLLAEIKTKYTSDRTLKYDYCLIQSVLANSDSQNLLIANAVQTGVREIYPCISDNVSVKKTVLLNKSDKWQKVAVENFKQCERADIPLINPISNLKDTLLNFEKNNIIIFAERNENCTLENLDGINLDKKIALVIGPEGGFSDNEFEYFKKSDFKLVTLGKMILKSPNAVVAAVTNVVSRLENDR